MSAWAARLSSSALPSRPTGSGPDESITTHGLLAQAARAALARAGREPADIDGLGVSSFSLAPDRAINLAVRLGVRLRWLMDGGTGGSSAIDLL